jgi:hypothetical protein
MFYNFRASINVKKLFTTLIYASEAGMSGIFIFVNTALFIRLGRDGKKIPLSVNTVLFRSQNTVKCLNDRY